MTKLPLTSVVAERVPCKDGDVTVTAAPGSDKPSSVVTVPVMIPVWTP
jgi:hypothetical protein